MATKEAELLKQAIDLGLGNEEFLKGLKPENLTTMIEAVKARDAKLMKEQVVNSKNSKPEAYKNVTTVGDLLNKGKITANEVDSKIKGK